MPNTWMPPTLRLSLALALATLFPGALEAQQEVTHVYLVRHAEKAELPEDDPALTPAGLARSQFLANLLKHAGLTEIHSTRYTRTIDTARPVADSTGLEIRFYDPRSLESFAAELKSTPGRHLVVGHSNTTPELVSLLGGDPGEPIDEATEYDRLYLLILHGDGAVSTILLRAER